jgi:hypothetical protein
MMVAASTTLVSAVSAAAALVSLLAYLYSLRRSERSAAREEALALAETRGEMLAELRRGLEEAERRHKRAKADADRRIRELDAALGRARREAHAPYEVQRLGVLVLAESLARVRDDLEQVPPNVDGALARIHGVLTDDELRSRVG